MLVRLATHRPNCTPPLQTPGRCHVSHDNSAFRWAEPARWARYGIVDSGGGTDLAATCNTAIAAVGPPELDCHCRRGLSAAESQWNRDDCDGRRSTHGRELCVGSSQEVTAPAADDL